LGEGHPPLGVPVAMAFRRVARAVLQGVRLLGPEETSGLRWPILGSLRLIRNQLRPRREALLGASGQGPTAFSSEFDEGGWFSPRGRAILERVRRHWTGTEAEAERAW